MTTEQEALTKRWGTLLTELHAALSGEEPHPRSTPSILRDLDHIRLDPSSKGLSLVRPCSWLAEWECIPVAGKVTELERERRQWVDAGWLPVTKEDERRQRMAVEAEKARIEFEAARQERFKQEQAAYAAQNRPITRRSLEQATEAINKVW